MLFGSSAFTKLIKPQKAYAYESIGTHTHTVYIQCAHTSLTHKPQTSDINPSGTVIMTFTFENKLPVKNCVLENKMENQLRLMFKHMFAHT